VILQKNKHVAMTFRGWSVKNGLFPAITSSKVFSKIPRRFHRSQMQNRSSEILPPATFRPGVFPVLQPHLPGLQTTKLVKKQSKNKTQK
jgi:hypothetical protein